jgi:hypothetical protein
MRSFIIVFIMSVTTVAFARPASSQVPQTAPAAVDYDGFTQLSIEVNQYRQKRLVPKSVFLKMADHPDTIILDTRSKEAFDQGHIKGAVHLNFSEFTDEKLAKTVGPKDRRILIYCNNNFIENAQPFPLKRLELALNIPTFINLYGYGYQNISELRDSVSMRDPDLQIIQSVIE